MFIDLLGQNGKVAAVVSRCGRGSISVLCPWMQAGRQWGDESGHALCSHMSDFVSVSVLLLSVWKAPSERAITFYMMGY